MTTRGRFFGGRFYHMAQRYLKAGDWHTLALYGRSVQNLVSLDNPLTVSKSKIGISSSGGPTRLLVELSFRLSRLWSHIDIECVLPPSSESTCTGSLPSEKTKRRRLSLVIHTVPEHIEHLAVLSSLLYSRSLASGPRCRLYTLTWTGPKVRQSPCFDDGGLKFRHSAGSGGGPVRSGCALGPAVRSWLKASLFSEISWEEVRDQIESVVECMLPAGPSAPEKPRMVDARSDTRLSDRKEEPASDSVALSTRGSCSAYDRGSAVSAAGDGG